jgi:hypothetical protein
MTRHESGITVQILEPFLFRSATENRSGNRARRFRNPDNAIRRIVPTIPQKVKFESNSSAGLAVWSSAKMAAAPYSSPLPLVRPRRSTDS